MVIQHANDSVEMSEGSSAADRLDGLFNNNSSNGNETVESDEVGSATTEPSAEYGDSEESAQDLSTSLGEEAINENAAFPKLQVKGDKKDYEFELNPDNEDLRKIIERGIGANRWAYEKTQAIKEAEALRTKLEGLEAARQKASLIDEVQDLMQRGYTAHAVKALLGEEGFESFKKQEIIGTIDYENATPEERFEMDRQRLDREKQWEIDKREKRLQELEKRAAEQQEQTSLDRAHGIGEKFLAKYDLSNYIDDPVIATKANTKLWSMAWDDLGSLGVHPSEFTTSQIEKAFRENAYFLRGLQERQVDSRLAKATEEKKKVAQSQAQLIARNNYAGQNNSNLGEKLKSSSSALERLKILGGFE